MKANNFQTRFHVTQLYQLFVACEWEFALYVNKQTLYTKPLILRKELSRLQIIYAKKALYRRVKVLRISTGVPVRTWVGTVAESHALNFFYKWFFYAFNRLDFHHFNELSFPWLYFPGKPHCKLTKNTSSPILPNKKFYCHT